jgi:ribosomal protein L3 glutamine methyltransferase
LKKRKARALRRTPVSHRPDCVTVADLVRSVAARLKRAKLIFAHGSADPVAEAAFIVGETLGVHPGYVEARRDMPVTSAQQKKISALVERRICTRKPAAYLLKRIYLRGVPFYIDEHAIVPRSYLGEILDSELFAGEDFSLVPDPGAVSRVLDLCTGSGCLAILAAGRFPKARVDAVELSKAAIEVARKNVVDHGLKKRVRLLRGDLFAPVKGERYDLIISNPPYVDAEGMAGLPRECRAEPKLAFDGGADGLDIVRRILDQAEAHLTPQGGLLCEIGRCRPQLDAAYPQLPLLWLDTEDSEAEVFFATAADLG